MKLITFKAFLVMLVLGVACQPEYQKTTATITDLKIEGEVNKATIEYFVDSVRYTDAFSITTEKLVEDSISMPHPGLTFEILYNPKDPSLNKIDFRVKPVYK